MFIYCFLQPDRLEAYIVAILSLLHGWKLRGIEEKKYKSQTEGVWNDRSRIKEHASAAQSVWHTSVRGASATTVAPWNDRLSSESETIDPRS